MRITEIIERFWKSIMKDALFRLSHLPQEMTFHSLEYLRINSRRLEHLASLHLPLAGKRVLELGAGIGDHSHYYLDRGCELTITEIRRSNLRYLRNRYPNIGIHYLDLENPAVLDGEPFDVVHCYGVLYHLTDPGKALSFIDRLCGRLLLLETVVSPDDEGDIHTVVKEFRINPTQSYVGRGTRPTRPWLFKELRKHFSYVYIPRTQPSHEQFPTDWTSPPSPDRLMRAIFIGSREPIDNALLSDQLLMMQEQRD